MVPVRERPPLLALLILIAAVAFPGLTFAQTPPNDIQGHPAEGRIRALLARHLVERFPDGTFRPHEPISRARYVAWLARVKGLPPLRPAQPTFIDVPLTFPLAAQVEAAAAFGVLPPGLTEFRPQDPITRIEAIDYTVRALGHTFESASMAGAALPFEDLGTLPALQRGAAAIVTLASPPLLREPPGARLRPHDAMTRGEAAGLLWGYLNALEQGMTLRATFRLAPGVTLVLEKRGALRVLPVWRVQVGTFPEEERATQLAIDLRRRGFLSFIEVVDTLYKVRVGNFATREEAEAAALQLAADGLVPVVVLTLRDFEGLAGPFWSAMLVIEDPGGFRLVPTLTKGDVLGRERPSVASRRAGALAATNGGFFSAAGDPLGCLMINQELISEPVHGRTCTGLLPDGTLLFDVVDFNGTVATESSTTPVHGVNRGRGPDELIVYRRVFGPSTRTNPFGVEAVVVGDVVQEVAEGRGNTPIPPGGYVLSGHGRSAAWMRAALHPGDRVSLRLDLVPASGDPRWRDAVHVIGGGPRILADGRYVGGEGFTPLFLQRRHPRTVLARLADGRVLLMVVDGRQPYHSVGVTLPELAVTLRALGATDAVNLDGGGSSTLVVRGTVVNLPSDEGGERAVADALLVIRP